MKRSLYLWISAALLVILSSFLFLSSTGPAQAQGDSPEIGPAVIGEVIDPQNQPVPEAQISWRSEEQVLAETQTQPDGTFILELPANVPVADSQSTGAQQPAENLPLAERLNRNPELHIERVHFEPATVQLEPDQVAQLGNGQPVEVPTITLNRKIGLAFWIATLIFIGMLVIIAAGVLHNALAALTGASLVLAVSYLGHPIQEDLFIFDFPTALEYVDWNVIFLIMGMMIVIAVVERTGIFQWLAYMAYRFSGGRTWLLLVILMTIAGVASAFLDNVTTMLLMTPITIQIALSLGMNPLALLMPAVMASNVIGISTLIGTPTNILIGSFAGISFNDFLVNLTPGVILAMIGLVIYSRFIYRKELETQADEEISSVLLDKLEERATITEPGHLRKAGWVGVGMIILFVFGESIHLLPAVTALLGATALLVWIRPDIEEMIEAVDWTTLVFFMTLFITVGAVQEVGLISYLAGVIGRIIGTNLILAMLAVTWLSAILSTVVANIPFTAAMLPVVGFLSATIPGADNKVLFFCLSVGAAMGGNGSLIGASANMVTAGISERAGYPITYVYFLKKGFPALLITVTLALIWLFVRFVFLV